MIKDLVLEGNSGLMIHKGCGSRGIYTFPMVSKSKSVYGFKCSECGKEWRLIEKPKRQRYNSKPMYK